MPSTNISVLHIIILVFTLSVLLRYVEEFPKYHAHLISLIKRYKQRYKESKIPTTLLFALENWLTQEFKGEIHEYFPLINQILKDKETNPNVNLHNLPNYLQRIIYKLLNTVKNSRMCREGDWNFGNDILTSVRFAMETHPASLISQSLCKLLFILRSQYNNIGNIEVAFLPFKQFKTDHISTNNF